MTEVKNHYIYISRKYTVSVSAGTGIESVSGGESYYYGATSIEDAAIDLKKIKKQYLKK